MSKKKVRPVQEKQRRNPLHIVVEREIPSCPFVAPGGRVISSKTNRRHATRSVPRKRKYKRDSEG